MRMKAITMRVLEITHVSRARVVKVARAVKPEKTVKPEKPEKAVKVKTPVNEKNEQLFPNHLSSV